MSHFTSGGLELMSDMMSDDQTELQKGAQIQVENWTLSWLLTEGSEYSCHCTFDFSFVYKSMSYLFHVS